MGITLAAELAKATTLNKKSFRVLVAFLMRFPKLNQFYNQTLTLPRLPFVDSMLEQLQVKYEVDARELENIPAKGAFIALANHPHGGLDDLLLLKILAAVRPELKILADSILKNIPGLEAYIIPVNSFKTQKQQSIPGLRQVLSCIHNDIPVGIFPAGEVSGWPAADCKVMGPEWPSGLGKLITQARVPVVPVYFTGGSSRSFNLLSLIQPFLRPRRPAAELTSKEEICVKIRIGKPICYPELNQLPPANLLPYVRAKTYALGAGLLKPNPWHSFTPALPTAKPVIGESSRAAIQAEIARLPAKSLLFAHQHYQVYLAACDQIPRVLRELGRLRELTFRAMGAGTNQETNLDLFDRHYHHLFVYDTSAGLLVGAYRLGKGNKIYRQFGKSGFYLHSLFKMKKEFTPILEQSVELGRSFVRPEYQTKTLPLLLLWQGIAIFLAGTKRYQYLLAPVSISHYFSAISKSLMVDFIRQHFFDHEMAALVAPRKKFRYRASAFSSERVRKENTQSIQSLDDLIAAIEPSRAHLPVFLKKYIKQNAQMIGFNLDPQFSNALNGLLIMRVENLPNATPLLLDQISLAE